MADAQRPRGNVPLRPLKWTVESGSREFRLSPVTLRKALRQSDTQPASDGTYSTAQIVSVLWGDLKGERLKKERQLVRKYELENAITEGAFVNRVELMKAFSTLAAGMVSRIMAADVPRSVKEDLLADLAGVPLVLENVVRSQTKLRRSGNGNGNED